MIIHTVKKGETLHEIARRYGVTPAKIIENNGITAPDRLSVGQKILILTPTRTYTVRGGDTLERISKRFEVTESSLKRTNPYLSEKKMTYPEQVIAIKYDTPSYRSAIFNGYYYRDTPKERFDFALAVSDMITVSAYRQDGGEIRRIYNDRDITEKILEAKKTPIMRIYFPDEYEKIKNSESRLIDGAIKHATDGKYGGVCIAARRASESEAFTDFLLELKRRLMIENLSLIMELDRVDASLSEIADFCVLTYEKCLFPNIPDFESGERRFFTDCAEQCDSTRAFVDLNSFGTLGGELKTHDELYATAYRLGREIHHDGEKKICYFDITARGGRYAESQRAVFESLENIKAKLGLLSELGFGGISYDIMRVPMAHIMMAISLFAPTYSPSFEI